MRVLFVCTGNICRSPMAERLLRHRAEEAGWTDVEVLSAGTWATDGSPATDEAQQVLLGAGVRGVSSHRSRTLTRGMVEEATVVVAMTSVHLREIESVAPGSKGKVFLIKELARLGNAEATGVEGLLASPRPEWRRAMDLDDPMGFGIGTYRSCFADISAGIEELVRRLRPSA
jgi:protein-tyrosine-phosphatase